MIRPILILSLICFFVTGILAFVNNLTYPVIESAAAERAANARKEIIPHADRFELLKINGLPLNVTQVYRAEYDKGFIFMVTTFGYGGEIKMICGIDPNGNVIKSAVLAHNETQGLGTPIFELPHAGQYWGKDKNGIETIDAISGATITSNAYKNGIRYALAAFEIVKSHPEGAR
ncbi:MAG: FMN-binding protein [Treponema sp.]|nr:FMN-binding protein [Treponema sp.]